jgi:uncharacterized DUF497 family protein
MSSREMIEARADGFIAGFTSMDGDPEEAKRETRITAIGYIGDRLHVAVFVDRDGSRRIISLRKANQREAKNYAET